MWVKKLCTQKFKKLLCVEHAVPGIVLCAYVLFNPHSSWRKEEAEAQFHKELV